VFNYSAESQEIAYPFASGKELLSGNKINNGQVITVEPWGITVIEEL
jgi:beta-galactosidase